jgi:hypothetical protein
LRLETRLSDLERDLSKGVVSTQDMAVSIVDRFDTFDIMSSGYIGARR